MTKKRKYYDLGFVYPKDRYRVEIDLCRGSAFCGNRKYASISLSEKQARKLVDDLVSAINRLDEVSVREAGRRIEESEKAVEQSKKNLEAAHKNLEYVHRRKEQRALDLGRMEHPYASKPKVVFISGDDEPSLKLGDSIFEGSSDE